MTINEERQLGRAKNAALSFLEQRLSVPKIYIDAEWAGAHVDVLAVPIVMAREMCMLSYSFPSTFPATMGQLNISHKQ